MRTSRKLLSVVLAAVVAAPARADTSAGSTPFDFLLFDANARAVGLAGAYTALACDANALRYNPAGLAEVRAPEATFMHNEYVEGLNQEYAGFASGRGWGASLNYLNFSGVTRTTLSQPGGTLGETGLSDLALEAGYGLALSESLSVGAGAKFIRENIDDLAAVGYAADLGALYKVPSVPGLTLGAAMLNLGPTVRFQSADESLPLDLRLGGAYVFGGADRRNTLALDLTKTVYDKVRLGLGAETALWKALALRLGFTTRSDAGLGITAGVGWIGRSLSADYAFVPMGELGTGHRLSVTFRWGQERARPAPPAIPEPAPEAAAPVATPAPTSEAEPAPVSAASEPAAAPVP